MAIEQENGAAGDIVLVHSSDLHVDDDRIAALHAGDGAAGLRDVLTTARELGADIVLLAGDTFDNHMVSAATVDRAGKALADAGLPIVLLPGNHDPLTKDSVYIRGGYATIPNLSIIGITHDRAVEFPRHDLEIWGNAHRDYLDMVPLHNPLRPSWLISDAMIRETQADYLALGHWDRAVKVGCGAVPAYYSGSPEYVHTVNLVRLTHNGDVIVSREEVRRPA
ncbi:MAG TPA: metallophosphoesterase [Stellaceae bacterium]|nr:metallophosphoesterase [Stellaceae bacterium]